MTDPKLVRNPIVWGINRYAEADTEACDTG